MKTKKILLISDTHGFHENLKEVVRLEAPFDRVLHMGDTEGWDPIIEEIVGVPVEIVAGNCDWASALPSEMAITISGIHIFMTHGHEYYVTTGMDVLRDQAAACGCQIALFGHTHRPLVEQCGGVLIANPGSISRPRQPGYEPSYGVLSIDETGLYRIDIKFLKK
ncbi:MAG: metallophosphoesterase [bacterium]|nr:metallophosphoesterase [bacterium]MDY4099892.1 metallophosphoesterase [Lachnospiraceae bacterium]